MSGYTPGPWIVFIGEDDFDVLPAGRQGEIAGRITNTHDASLIAAAPDMFKALQGAMVIIEMMSWPDHSSHGLRSAFDKRRDAILAAIAKATSKTP